MSRTLETPGPVLFPTSSALLGFHRIPGLHVADQPHQEALRWEGQGKPKSIPLFLCVCQHLLKSRFLWR